MARRRTLSGGPAPRPGLEVEAQSGRPAICRTIATSECHLGYQRNQSLFSVANFYMPIGAIGTSVSVMYCGSFCFI